MPKINRVDIYARAIKKYSGGSGVSENYVTGQKLEILQLTEIYQDEMKKNFTINWKILSKCSDTGIEKLGHIDNGEEFLTITIKVKNITPNKGGKNIQLTYMETKFRLLLFPPRNYLP